MQKIILLLIALLTIQISTAQTDESETESEMTNEPEMTKMAEPEPEDEVATSDDEDDMDSTEKSNDRAYSMGGNYQMVSQNPSGTNPSLSINLLITGSVIFRDTHEVGLSLSLNASIQEITITDDEQISTTQTTGIYYRYNMMISKEDAKVPIQLYFGPQIGITTITTNDNDNSNTSIGAQMGVNYMLSEQLAINFHILQWDLIMAEDDNGDDQLIITQSVGIKYFF